MRHLRALLVRLAVLLLVAAVACAAAPAGDLPGSRIARGVRAGDVVLTGLTAQPARVRLRQEVALPLRLTAGAESWTVPSARFVVAADIDAVVREALVARPGKAIALPIRLDRAAIRAYVARLARRYARPARDAELVGLDAGLRPLFAPPRPGRKLHAAHAKRTLRRALARGDRSGIRLRFLAVAPEVTAREFGPVIVIRRGSNSLTLFDGPRMVRTFRVATGQASYPTPLGRVEVVDKQYHPWWYPPPSDWAEGLQPVPPGPGNPLGTRWMGLSAWGVGIHGTPDAASVGYSASHGCIRMYVPDAEWLFEQVTIGTPVFIVPA
jgi:hypothetical protein